MAVAAHGLEGRTTAIPDARRRRLLYGLNVGLAVILAFALLVIGVWLADRASVQWDWTTSGVNSLSPRTEKLVSGLNQKITLTGIYSILSEYQTVEQKRQKRVADMLSLYEAVAPANIDAIMIDPMKEDAKLKALLQRLKEKPAYQSESEPHRKVLEDFPPLIQDLRVLLSGELDTMKAIPPEAQADKFNIVQRNFEVIVTETDYVLDQVRTLLEGEFPQYGAAVDAVKNFLPRVEAALSTARTWGISVAAGRTDLPEQARSFYADAGNRYTDLLDRLAFITKAAQDLSNTELDKMYDKLRGAVGSPVIVVESPEEARVLDMAAVWPFRRSGEQVPQGDDPREFAGERAISSAILELTQKEKTAIIFTHWGGPSPLEPDFSQFNPQNMRDLPTAPYIQVKEYLEDSNFLTATWDVQKEKQPPVIENASRRVYVVMRPTNPQPPAPNQPPPPGMSPADKQLILDAVRESGMALFLAGYSAPTSQMEAFTGGGPPYEYNDYLKSEWGIEVQSKLLVLAFQPNPENSELYFPRNQRRDVLALYSNVQPDQLDYGDHPIVEPLRSLALVLMSVAPLKVDPPAGVEVTPLLRTPASKDIWAVSNIMRAQQDMQRSPLSEAGTRRYEEDFPSTPDGIVVAAAAEKTGGAGRARIVVSSSEDFAMDAVAFQRTLAFAGNTPIMVSSFPANIEFFVNSLHWLTGEAGRIAVGPSGEEYPRLSKLEEGPMLSFWRVFLVGIWPALMLLAGAGVWFFRRK